MALETLNPEQRKRLAVLDGLPAGMLMVHEIYASLQGESTYAGLPCTFVRLTGCPLRCRWCDTPHAFTEGRAMTLEDVVAAVEVLSPRLVELTGGEPLSQPLCNDLMRTLADAGLKVLLETSGAISIEAVDPRVTIIMDLKCPDSGELESNRLENLSLLRPGDELKFVLSSRRDFDWSIEMIRTYRLDRWPLLFSVVFGELEPKLLADWILEAGLPIRFQMQLHKHIWGPSTRGV